MKKLSKLMALLLSLLMILSLFAACGDNKKDDDDDDDDDEKKEKTSETSEVKDDDDEDEDNKKDDLEYVEDETIGNSFEDVPDYDYDDYYSDSSTEDLLVGDWEAECEVSGIVVPLLFTFKANGDVKMDFTLENYNDMVDQTVDANATTEEEAENIRESIETNVPYNDLKSMFVRSGYWELDGDTLTMDLAGEIIISETDLTSGSTYFEFESAGVIFELTKK